jgi:hypothetical protein
MLGIMWKKICKHWKVEERIFFCWIIVLLAYVEIFL